MPTKKYTIKELGEKELTLTWRGKWKDVNISLDGQELGVVADHKAMQEGNVYTINGDTLSVCLRGKVLPELEIKVNGKQAQKTAWDPVFQIDIISKIAFIMGGLTAVVSLMAEIAEISFLRSVGFGWITFFTGVITVLLGFGVKQRSKIALGILIGLLVVDLAAMFIVAVQTNGNPAVGVVVKLIFLMYMGRGFSAINELSSTQEVLDG
ncbi:MAG: hypothetical protein JJ975_08185 [Bacteroidia bacterium]|nr:hypothetical protein [Bacteroidia bacterium]